MITIALMAACTCLGVWIGSKIYDGEPDLSDWSRQQEFNEQEYNYNLYNGRINEEYLKYIDNEPTHDVRSSGASTGE